MKPFSYLRICILMLLCAVLLDACFQGRPKIKPVNPAFGKYITGYRSGMISRKSNIRIELAQAPRMVTRDKDARAIDSAISISGARQVLDSSLLEDIFEFEPAVKGHAVWVNERVIDFIPDEPLLSNQFYDADFDLGRLQKVPGDLETFHFQFSTYPQNLSVNLNGLRVYDSYHSEFQKFSGSLTTSDYEDTARIKKLLTVTENGKPRQVNWSFAYENNECYFYVDSIERRGIEGQVVVEWNGALINSLQKGRQVYIIPSLSDFSVSEVKVIDKIDQSLELYFTDPIQAGQDLRGIVNIEGVDDLTYSIEENVVKVFLPARVEGNKTLTVTTGIKNFKGYKMENAYTDELTFEAPKPLVLIKGKGSILPSTNGMIFPFEAISLKAVDVRIIKIMESNVHQFLQVNDLDGNDELTRVGKIVADTTIRLDQDKSRNLKQWNAHVLDLSKLISPDPGSIYRVSIRFKKEYAVCDCSDETQETRRNNEEDGEEMEAGDDESEGYSYLPPVAPPDWDKDWNEDHWYTGSFGGYESWYNYYDETDYGVCDQSYYNGKAVSRNILASDIGLIYKQEDSKVTHAFVSNMLTAKPLPNAIIEYYDYNRELIATGKSDASGMLDMQLKRKPFLMIAKYGRQRGYLKLRDGSNNSLSKFDIWGEVVQKGVKGFIYGERGVWRPGDSLYLTFIMEDKEHRLPANHPVKFELQDPNGQIIYQVSKTAHVNGMYDFRTATSPDAPTGNYQAIVHIGNRVFSQPVKIETVKPNRLKIYLDFGSNNLTRTGADSTLKLQARWLHGAIAKNLRATVNMSVYPMETQFNQFPDYEFDSPVRTFATDAEAIFDGNLDASGEARVPVHVAVDQAAPGMLRASYTTRVFEEGGDFSIDRYSMPYSPYPTYIGLHAPAFKGYENTYETGHDYKFDIASVNAAGQLVAAGKVQVKIYKMQWRWWYENGSEDLATYISRSGTIVAKDTMLKTVNGKGSFRFRVNYPDYGRYLVTVTDLEGGHQTGKIIFIDWPYWSRANRSDNENATMLSFASDKEKYTKGETIKLTIPSPADGQALISVESGTRVIRKFWVNTVKGETHCEFKATADMAPNAYVHVTLLQPHANTKNDLPIRMYGVIPVVVDDPNTHLYPMIAMADVIQPESNTIVKVREKTGRRMTYTLAMVDEGLLDLTRFKTPQPWNTFYAREALGVKTWDMYDAVIGAYAGKLDKLLSIGGDGDGAGAKGVKANRFKPMVKFLGPFVLEPGQEAAHKISIPNYVGSVRVMVVAEQDAAYGNAEKTVSVRKPLMLLATLPRVMGPGETVQLPVDVFAMENHVKAVKVEVEVNDMLVMEGTRQQTLHFSQIGDEVINFRLQVAEKVGIARVKVTATCGKEKAVQEIEVDVRTPNPKVSDGYAMVIEPGKTWNKDIAFKGLGGTNKVTVELSTIPSLGLEKHMDYLINYPHGCIEQTTSSVFPQLFVDNLMKLKESQKQRIARNVKAGLRRLQLFQTSGGGFSYWPGEGMESEWGSNYAGHFMIEAEKQGYSLPPNMKSKWIKYQQRQARNWSANGNPYSHPHGVETNEVIQAYRLFVLALANSPELGAMNRLREERNLSETAKWRLAAAYYLVGQTEVAQQLIKNLKTTVVSYKELSYSYGSDTRDVAMILETLSIMKERNRASAVAKEVAFKLNSARWMSTQEAGYSLLAVCEYANVKNSSSEINFTYAVNKGAEVPQYSNKTLHQVTLTEADFDKRGALVLKNTGQGTLFAKIIVEGIPLIGDQTSKFSGLAMQVQYTDMKGVEIKPDQLQQGTDFKAVVTITNPNDDKMLEEMVLSQIFPSGWEIHNTRMDENGAASPARYQDIRDDRVYSYYSLAPHAAKTFVVQLNATYLGRFYLPTLYTEAMYDDMINARLPGKWVEVVKELPAAATK